MELLLRYDRPAPNSDDGWEKYSLPIGCGYLGGNVFGDVAEDRIQVTENSVENPGNLGGLNSLADIYLNFAQSYEACTDYERSLDIGRAVACTRYTADGIKVERKYFASYPDRALVGSVTSDRPLDFSVTLKVPHLTDEEERRKTGSVTSDGDTLTMTGSMYAYNVRFAAVLRVFSDGCVTPDGDTLKISAATKTSWVFCAATNYVLRPEVFTETDNRKKLDDFDPLPIAQKLSDDACSFGYDKLLERHISDFTSLMGRVALNLGETEVPHEMTDRLLEKYAEGSRSRYVEALYFQFGRYLLISSSRPGTLPANLQGVWNCHDKSPWGSGYWHNINVQMNYWPAFITNIGETFDAYLDYNLAFRKMAQKFAADYIKYYVPENHSDIEGECGWTIGTGNYSYCISGPGGHSGPGTGGLTSKLFWEYYDFVGDKKLLREVTYPALLSMAKFLTKVVRDYDGKLLSEFSASPEQILTNTWTKPVAYYHTVGCAFDQQMLRENAADLLKCVDILGEDTLPEEDRAFIALQREQLDKYDPVQVGWSGQIKEYREENFYGEYGEYRHRHISQLVGLYPGTLISRETPAWLDAAKVSLDLRSDLSTGWALAHRLNSWARTGDGDRAYKLYSNLLGTRTLPNLWDTHPPFQIDGNLGGTSGVAEMLLQSHEKDIVPLAALPCDWNDGSFNGLMARGGFVFDIEWKDGCAVKMVIRSLCGNICRIKYPNIALSKADFDFEADGSDRVEFATKPDTTYTFDMIPYRAKKPYPTDFTVDRTLRLSWDFSEPVNIWRASDSSPDYVLAASNVTGGSYTDADINFDACETLTYKLTRADTNDPTADGAWKTLNHSTALQRRQYRYLIRQLNIPCGGAEAAEWLGE